MGLELIWFFTKLHRYEQYDWANADARSEYTLNDSMQKPLVHQNISSVQAKNVYMSFAHKYTFFGARKKITYNDALHKNALVFDMYFIMSEEHF